MEVAKRKQTSLFLPASCCESKPLCDPSHDHHGWGIPPSLCSPSLGKRYTGWCTAISPNVRPPSRWCTVPRSRWWWSKRLGEALLST